MKKRTMDIGIIVLSLLAIVGVIVFWGTLGYVVIHFIQKFW